MQLGMIGLGRMGGNMVRRLLKAGHQCVVFDKFTKAVDDLAREKAVGSSSFADMVQKLEAPRAIWAIAALDRLREIDLPAGESAKPAYCALIG